MPSTKDIFETKLRYQVAAYFENKGINKCADKRVLVKALFFLLLFTSSYALVLLSPNMATLFFSYSVLGLSNILVSINIGHEAIHNCLSAKRQLNYLGRLAFNLAGVSSSIWGTKHLNSHHKHTNIPELDTDFQQSKFVRLELNFPKSKFHPFQPYYIPLFYLLYTFHWTYIKDFKEIFSLHIKAGSVHKAKLLSALLINKSLYLLLFLFVPFLAQGNNVNVIYGFLFSYLVTGAFFGLFLIPIHINQYAIIHGKELHNRLSFVEQLESTPNFSTTNKILNFLLGGFNHHACHHLFPSISHIHYPHLTRLIRDLSREEGVRYHDLTFSQLIVSHFRHLRILAKSS